MKGDVPLLLDKYRSFLLELKKLYLNGKIQSDIVYQERLLGALIDHYITCLDYYLSLIPEMKGPEKVFVILPGNVPIVIFQLLPGFIVSGVKEVYFKQPFIERSLYNQVIPLANSFLKPHMNLRTSYLSHEESLSVLKNYDFVVGYGGSLLGDFLNFTGKPYRFFGPKLSIGILKGAPTEDVLKRIAFDNLAFDTRGCLSLRYLFTFDPIHIEEIFSAMEVVSKELPPQNNFDYSIAEYEVLKSSWKGERVVKGENFFIVYSDGVLEISAPRTLNIVRVESYKELESQLLKIKDYIQGIATNGIYPEFTSASYYALFGKLQFTPCNWCFEKGVTWENFWEVNDV
ncbi:MAG: acyl-CoA reductase [candidate division WOR-3 bacterium]